MKQIVLSAATLALLLLPATRTWADELVELKEQLEVQQQLMQQMQERLAQLEARQRLKERSLNDKIAEVSKQAEAAQKSAPGGLPASLSWAENIKWSGDFRYRHEHIDAEETNSPVGWANGRDRHRIRARLMIESVINDEWGVGFRLASGSSDSPTSTNQTLENSFESKDLWLDLAYFDYKPASMPGLKVTGGKIKNPFYKVGKNQLIWDGDLNPEGIAFSHTRDLSDTDQLVVNGGGFWIDEDSGIDTSLWGIQAYWKREIGNPDTIIAGASFFDYGNIEGENPAGVALTGNTPHPANAANYASDFNILELFAEYGTEISGLPFSIYGNWANNTHAATSEDTGWLVGAMLGKAKDPGSWQLGYNYRVIEADAVVGGLNDSGFINGGTGGRGHKFSCAYQIAKNVQGALTYLHNEDDSTSSTKDLDYRRLQADLVIKFK